MMFTAEDVERAERRYGVAYFVSKDGRSMIPATHVGLERLAVISHCPPLNGRRGWYSWKIRDDNGELLLHSTESYWTSKDRFRALRRAVEAVHKSGAATRIRPGDNGPWGPGAANG